MPVTPIPLLQDIDAQGAATIKGLRDPVAAGDAVSKSYLDVAIGKVSAPAAQNLSGHRAVLLTSGETLDYPSLSSASDGQQILGLSTQAANIGGNCVVQVAGLIIEPSWTWTRGPVFAGDLGVLTQTPPVGAWVRQVGVAIAATKIVIEIKPVILT
jgi:hypothetical protein